MRYIIAATCALVGMCSAAAQMIVCFVADPELIQSVVKKDVPGTAMMTGVCATFFAVTYSLGVVLNERLGEHHDAEQLRRFAQVHLAILHVLASGYLVAAVLVGIRRGDWITSSLVIGLCLLGLSAWELWRTYKRRRRVARASRA